MSSEEQIEEILIKANSIGFKKELLERVRQIMNNDTNNDYVNVLVKELQLILNEITD